MTGTWRSWLEALALVTTEARDDVRLALAGAATDIRHGAIRVRSRVLAAGHSIPDAVFVVCVLYLTIGEERLSTVIF